MPWTPTAPDSACRLQIRALPLQPAKARPKASGCAPPFAAANPFQFRSCFDSNQTRQTVRQGRFQGLLFAPVFAVMRGFMRPRNGFEPATKPHRGGAACARPPPSHAQRPQTPDAARLEMAASRCLCAGDSPLSFRTLGLEKAVFRICRASIEGRCLRLLTAHRFWRFRQFQKPDLRQLGCLLHRRPHSATIADFAIALRAPKPGKPCDGGVFGAFYLLLFLQ